ncbi:hypothetical protein FF38_13491 [Lucilia cuprina]|uniref:Uncharacterized protein n=1 Tax=Lucilia cuprina TaxID=7375 RepID=A0A0L0CEK1_LUCCU|nr:hypothetical protein FF38_13491 [Lucilia cuprina]
MEYTTSFSSSSFFLSEGEFIGVYSPASNSWGFSHGMDLESFIIVVSMVKAALTASDVLEESLLMLLALAKVLAESFLVVALRRLTACCGDCASVSVGVDASLLTLLLLLATSDVFWPIAVGKDAVVCIVVCILNSLIIISLLIIAEVAVISLWLLSLSMELLFFAVNNWEAGVSWADVVDEVVFVVGGGSPVLLMAFTKQPTDLVKCCCLQALAFRADSLLAVIRLFQKCFKFILTLFGFVGQPRVNAIILKILQETFQLYTKPQCTNR